ncbi:MAG TPA: hypothetical protein VMX13_07875 [Sedimentisphaerales bacterium]|nr:hypothetical protein [Sedimentisphaerales bacterium]
MKLTDPAKTQVLLLLICFCAAGINVRGSSKAFAARKAPPADVQQLLEESSRASLLQKLDDVNYAGQWFYIAEKLCDLSKRGDADSVRALLKYLRRGEDLKGAATEDHSRFLGKVRALRLIGRIGGKEADGILRKALTEEGSLELAKEWIDGPLPGKYNKNRTETLGVMRGSAAQGIVFAGDAENIKLVEKLYERVHEDCKNKAVVNELYYQLVDAMAARDFVADNGLEEYFNVSGNEVRAGKLDPYIKKYGWMWQAPIKETPEQDASGEKTEAADPQAPVPESVRQEANRLFGEKVIRIGRRNVSTLASRACEPYRIYNVTIDSAGVAFYEERIDTMAFGDQSFRLSEPEEAATFLTSLKKPVSNELEALERTVVFAELTRRTIRTDIPARRSIIEEFAKQKPEDWQLVISGTQAGWMVAVTLMSNPRVETCWRYDLEVSRQGAVSIASQKPVYQYVFLE